MNNIWKSDQPIQNSQEDSCGWNNIIPNIAETIHKLPHDIPFVMSINGKWGSGKSSFLNLLVEEIEKVRENNLTGKQEELLVFRFEPWLFSGHEALTTVFLNELCSFFSGLKSDGKADKVLSNLVDLLISYEKAIIAATAATNPVLGIATGAGTYFLKKWSKKKNNKKTVYDKKKDIQSALKKWEHRIVVVIDDIDRLLAHEMIQIFQLIKSVADFPNVLYILAYDLDVVAKTIQKAQEGDPYEYQEKIVQFSVTVPKIPSRVIEDLMAQEIAELVGSVVFNKLTSSFEWQRLWVLEIKPHLLNLRFPKRFLNHFNWNFSLLKSNIYFEDILVFSIIITLKPDIINVFYEFYNYYNILFESQYDDNELTKAKDKITSIFKDAPTHIMACLYHVFPGIKNGCDYKTIDEMSKRIAHPKNLKRILELCTDPFEILTPNKIELQLQECTTFENAEVVFISIPDQYKSEWILEASKILNKPELTNNLEPIVKMIIINGDKSFDTKDRLIDFNFTLLFFTKTLLEQISLNAPKKPYQIMTGVTQALPHVLSIPLKFTFFEGKAINLEPKYPPEDQTESIFTKEEILALREILCKRINELHKVGKLHKDILAFSLECLYNWSEKNNAIEIAKSYYYGDENSVITYIDAHKKIVRGGDSVNSINYKFSRDEFGEYTELPELITRAEEIKNSDAWADLDGEQKRILHVFLEAIRGNHRADFEHTLNN